MIGVKRLQRAIADVNLGGMQTGDPKVKLKLADAERLVLEIQDMWKDLEFFLEQSNIIEHMQDHKRMLELREKYGMGW